MIFVIKTIIKYFLIPFGILLAVLNRSKNEILVLMYHRIDNGVKKELGVSVRDFCWHMNYLYKKKFNVISMDEAYSMISRNAIKGKHIVLTFDDGYKDYYTNAYPILKKYDFPSIVYVCPGYIDTNKRYWWDRDDKRVQLMSWEDICKLNKEGLVNFGSHTMNHCDMDKLSIAEIKNELEMSKKVLEERIGNSIRHFAYPRGIYSKAGEELLKEYYDTGVLISNGRKIDKNCNMQHIYILKRIPVLKSDGRYLFVARLKGWLVVEEFIRKCLFHCRTIRGINHIL